MRDYPRSSTFSSALSLNLTYFTMAESVQHIFNNLLSTLKPSNKNIKSAHINFSRDYFAERNADEQVLYWHCMLQLWIAFIFMEWHIMIAELVTVCKVDEADFEARTLYGTWK
ncbi:uncharacterized protein LOC119648597 [Hermetia illucens]|uniref:uncharacterized protein LOC119648597 n=1 Tax=Hermetia illucens TaxID=343691 RepID=UPI0018CC281F|nr:uncharacterized protein LOC119648597 [Hermetia illucens]